MNATTKEIYQYALGAIIVLSSAIITVVLIWKPVPIESHDIVVLCSGQLYTLAGLVVGYFFGTSLSSSQKTGALTDALGKLTDSSK